MRVRVAVKANEAVVETLSIRQLDRVISDAGTAAMREGALSVVQLEAESGNGLAVVVGGTESVLSFTSAHGNPPYYASRGNADSFEPVLTAYFLGEHYTEFPRRNVVSMHQAALALREFQADGQRPTCVSWEEV